MAGPLASAAREAILEDAMAKAAKEGWLPEHRIGHRATMRTADNAETLLLEVDDEGEIHQSQRVNNAEAVRESLRTDAPKQRAWWLIAWAIVVIVLAYAFEASAASAPQETVVWVQACFWLIVGICVYLAFRG
jgi:hypothetical protein